MKAVFMATYGKKEDMFVAEMDGQSVFPVKKTELIDALKKNMLGHRKLFEEAQKGFRDTVIEELDKRLADARSGREINALLHLEAPQDHTKDYERTIKMLEMCTKEEVFVSEQEFAQYVMDDWKWMHQFVASNAGYITKGRSR